MLRITEIIETCSACPSPWEGKLEDGRHFYARFRFGYLSFSVGSSVDDAVMGEEVYGRKVSDGLDGVMSMDDMMRHVGAVLA